MIDFDNPYFQIPEPEPPPVEEPDPLSPVAVSQAGVWFGGSFFLTMLVRFLPAIAPLYWILMILAIGGMGLMGANTKRLRFLAMALVLSAGSLAGHWDWLAHTANQLNQGGEAAISQPVDPRGGQP